MYMYILTIFAHHMFMYMLIQFYVLLLQFKKAVVDKLKKPTVLPFSHIGIQWKGSPATTCTPYGFVRRVNLVGMNGPDNFFTIFLPEEAVQPQQSQEGVQCMC